MKYVPIVLAALTLGCTAAQKNIAKTVLDVARNACDLYAAQNGLSVKDVCATEEQLRPFVDGFLAASQAAGSARTAAMSGAGACVEEESKTPETAEE